MKKYYLFIFIICLLVNTKVFPQLVSDFKVNNDTTNYTQNYSKIGVDAEGNFVIVWQDNRSGVTYDLYMNLYNKNGIPLTGNIKINPSQTQAGAGEIAMKPNGRFFLSWSEFSGTRNSIKLKMFSKTFDSLSTSITCNDDFIKRKAYPKIGISPEGNVIVSWLEYTESFANYQIMLQRFDSTGNKIGGNVAATDTARDKANNTLWIRNDGSYLVCYDESSVGGGRSVIAKLFDKNGNFISLNRVNDISSLWYYFSEPIISADSLGRFCVAFNMYDFNANTNGVLFQLFNKDGSKKGSNVNYGSSGFDQFGALVIKKRNGELLLSYEAGYRMFMKKADSSGNYIGSQFQVSNQGLSSSQNCNGFQIVNNKIITTWTDNRYGNLDVFCNIRSYINPDSVVSVNNISTTVPQAFKLYQNYPNPFNPETTIKFDVKKAGNVKLKVFDELGKEILILVNENFMSGSYELKYNFSSLSSGIYYYSLFYNNNTMDYKKLILVK